MAQVSHTVGPAMDGNNRVGACPGRQLDGIPGAPLDGISGTPLDGISATLQTSIEGAFCKTAEPLRVNARRTIGALPASRAF